MEAGAIQELNRKLADEMQRLKTRRRRNRRLALAATALSVTAIVLLARFVVGAKVVSSDCMYPSIQPGDLVVYSNLDQAADRGGIVVFSRQGGDTVKRVIGVAGDEIRIDVASGEVCRNGQPLEEPYVTLRGETGESQAAKVPAGCLLAMGDNRPAPADGRMVEMVFQAQLRGKVILVLHREGY